jgi:fumarylacetoacetate (FAA) hydrolase family protein
MLGATGSSVRVGDIAASTAAQTGTLSYVTVDADGTLGRGTGPDLSGLAALSANQAAQGTQINTLFDLADLNRRDIGRANEGVAMALAMESPNLPAGATFAVGGGFGYYNHRTAGTASFTARVGNMSQVSAGVGFGLNSGEVGARAGFQHAW